MHYIYTCSLQNNQHCEYTRRMYPHHIKEFPLIEKKLMSFMKLTEKSNFDNLYSKPVCHVVSKAFSISKNVAAVDILLLKLRVT
jgi:hypothetical protein